MDHPCERSISALFKKLRLGRVNSIVLHKHVYTTSNSADDNKRLSVPGLRCILIWFLHRQIAPEMHLAPHGACAGGRWEMPRAPGPDAGQARTAHTAVLPRVHAVGSSPGRAYWT